MEHLLLPHGAELGEEDEVPYVGGATFEGDPYDGGLFLGYPQRVQKTRLLNFYYEGSMDTTYDGKDPKLMAELEAFLQTWLFFGMLHEFFRAQPYRAEDFVRYSHSTITENRDRADSDGLESRSASHAVITTASLPSLVEAWSKLPGDAENAGDDIFQHLRACIQLASDVLASVPSWFHPSIKTSICSVLELLDQALLWRFADSQPREVTRGMYTEHEGLKNRMIDNGWCPRQISALRENWGTCASFHFLSHLDVRSPLRNHSSCSSHQCLASSTRPGEGVAHTSYCEGDCSDFSIRGEDLIEVLEAGQTPVLKVVTNFETGEFAVYLVPATDETRYIAISHVWLDGLGNAAENMLRGCQVVRLGQLVAAIPVGGESIGQDGTFLWIDTLCCPSAAYPYGKALTLKRMKRIYEDAAAVLVLDSGLQSVNASGVGGLEACARLLTSLWMSRLWTLQEAFLAKNLLVQFKDGWAPLDAASDQIHEASKELVFVSILANQILGAYIHLRQFGQPVSTSDQPGLQFYTLCQSVRYRSVTFAADEPLCLSTLFQLDHPQAGSLGLVSPEERMPHFWTILDTQRHRIPQYVIFLDRPKLTRIGFRGLPSTLLRTGMNREDHIMQSGEPVSYGSLSSEGFKVKYPGCIFNTAPRPAGIPENLWGSAPKHIHSVHVRDELGKWYEVHDLDKGHDEDSGKVPLAHLVYQSQNRGQHLAFIWDRTLVMDELSPYMGATGILASLTRRDASVLYVRFLRYVLVDTARRATAFIYKTLEAAGRELREHPVSKRFEAFGEDVPETELDAPLELQQAADALRLEVAAATDRAWLRMREELDESVMLPRSENYLTRFYLGQYCLADSILPATQEWCVD